MVQRGYYASISVLSAIFLASFRKGSRRSTLVLLIRNARSIALLGSISRNFSS